MDKCPECGAVYGDESFSLYQRAKEYAKVRLDQRAEKKKRGEKLHGITNILARAFFHGFVCGSREEKEGKNHYETKTLD